MKCPTCQFDNEADAKFCNRCGSKLEIVCPKCGKSNRLASHFCKECGHNLTLPSEPSLKELSFEEKIDKIQRYLPNGLTEKILAQRDKIEGEHKQVTVMFCDMEGFTALTEELGPEEAYGIMDQVYEILIHKVHDYEGTVNEMTGDGIMALFGAPIALEDAPQRAIRSAMAIHRNMAKFSDGIKQERQGIPILKMRIGIHTGPVVVGTLGNNLRVEFKAVGETVNLASRMEGLAQAGATYVTENIFKLTEGLFRFEALGEKEVKGKKEPVKVYRVIAPRTSRTRFDVSAERGLTPFLGRERELELLMEGFERVKAGRGQAFSIISEVGMGKSRLLYEFRKWVSGEDVTFLEGKCLSYNRGVAYHPVIDILKSNFNVQENEEDSAIREKVRNGLQILDADEATIFPYLLELLSVKDSGIDKFIMSPEGRKDQLIEALKRIVLKGSEMRPLIMAFEDLHWMDKSSEEVMKYVLESIPGARVLLIFTYRPEFVHTWGGRSYHSHLTLNRLSNQESLRIMTYLLGTEKIDMDLEALVLEKTEGVPFFIEEYISSLKELRIIERKEDKYHLAKDIQELTIPSTIQEVIMARVDSLPEEAKDLLQIGSVIEREFGYEVIRTATGLPEQQLLSRLSVLKDSELVYERGIYPQSTYVFKHALPREVVYESILSGKRKRIHETIGNTLAKLYGENIVEYYGVIAEHYFLAENYGKAAEYSKLAGKKAQKAASFWDAISYGEKRIVCLERLDKTEEVEKEIIDARVTLGFYYLSMTHPDKAKEVVAEIVEAAKKRDLKRRLSQIYTIFGTYSYIVEENYLEGIKFLEDALCIAQELGDFISLWMASHWIGHAFAENCEFDRALYHLENALKISEAGNQLWVTAIMKSCIAHTVYDAQGNITLSYKTSKEGVRLAEDSGDIFAMAEAYTNHGCSCYTKGLLDQAEKCLLRGKAYCDRIGYSIESALASSYLGHTYLDKGEYVKSKKYFSDANSIMQYCNLWPSAIKGNKVFLAKSMLMNKGTDIDINVLRCYINENKIKEYDGGVKRTFGEILLNIDDQYISEAEQWMERSIESDRKHGTLWNLGRDYAAYAELFKRKGDQSKAKENITKAIHILKECGADGWVKKYEEEMVSIS